MGVGEMLDAAINLYRLHWKTFMAIGMFVLVPFQFLTQLVGRRLDDPSTLIRIDELTGEVSFSRSAAPTLIVLVALGLVQFLLLSPFITAAMTRAVARSYLGEVPDVGSVYRFALARAAPLLLVLFLAALGVGGIVLATAALAVGVALLGGAGPSALLLTGGAVLGIILWVRWLFGPAALVVEDVRGRAALRRSWDLSRGKFWKILGTMLLAGLLAAIVGGVFGVVPDLIAQNLETGGWLVRAVGGSLAQIITTPFTTIVTVLLYFDMRIRKEGFDLAIMAQETGFSPS